MERLTVYAVLPTRRWRTALEYLDRFGAERTATRDEYEYPQFGNQIECVYSRVEDAAARLEMEEKELFSVYWNVRDPNSPFGVSWISLHYTSDAGAYVGVTVREDRVVGLLNDLRITFDTEWAYVTGDECPPCTIGEVLDICQNATPPVIIRSQIVRADH